MQIQYSVGDTNLLLCTLHPHPMPMCASIHARTYQRARTRLSILRDGKAAHPQQVQPLLVDRVPTPCPSLHPPRPLDCLCPRPHRGLRHSCSPHLRFHPMPLSVRVGTPRTHTPCTVRVHACTVRTCSIHAVHAMRPGTCECRTLGAASVPVFGQEEEEEEEGTCKRKALLIKLDFSATESGEKAWQRLERIKESMPKDKETLWKVKVR